MKKILKAIWNEFVHGGYWPGLSVLIIVWAGAKFINFDIPFYFAISVFITGYIAYSVDRIIDDENDSYYKKMVLAFISLVTFVIMFTVDVKFASFPLLLCFVGLSIFGILYNIYFKKITRSVLGMKNYLVALTFPLSLLFVVFLRPGEWVNILLIYLFFTIRLLMNTSFGDLKDLESDKEFGLKTFPIRLGEKDFFKFLNIINIVSIAPILLGVGLKLLSHSALIFVVTILYALQYLSLAQKKGRDIGKLSAYWADGEPLIWLLCGLIGGCLAVN